MRLCWIPVKMMFHCWYPTSNWVKKADPHNRTAPVPLGAGHFDPRTDLAVRGALVAVRARCAAALPGRLRVAAAEFRGSHRGFSIADRKAWLVFFGGKKPKKTTFHGDESIIYVWYILILWFMSDVCLRGKVWHAYEFLGNRFSCGWFRDSKFPASNSIIAVNSPLVVG